LNLAWIIIAALIAAAGGAVLAWQFWPRRAPDLPRGNIDGTPPGDTTLARMFASKAPTEDPSGESLSALNRRMWCLVFGVESDALPPAAEHEPLRHATRATLAAGALDDRYFPRRPTLMPQLMAAVHSATAGASKLAGILAQDPVLAGDVLRLANSALMRPGSQPIESIQRAVVVCGTDGLQSLAARALLQPVFRSTGAVFNQFPPRLWEFSGLASIAAGAYTRARDPNDAQTAQLLALLATLGPLVVYRVLADQYRAHPQLKPSATLFLQMIAEAGTATTLRVAGAWDLSQRMQLALAAAGDSRSVPPDEELARLVEAQHAGAMLATLSMLCDTGQLGPAESEHIALTAGISPDLWRQLRERKG